MICQALEVIKPKRLYENYYCLFNNNKVSLLFDTTVITVRIGCIYNQYKEPITVKDAYQIDRQMPTSIFNEEPSIRVFSEPLNFEINADAATFFSVIAGLGEDTFVDGSITVEKNKITFEVLGVNYLCSYAFDTLVDRKFKVNINWHCFYYLFKLFGKLSGKKVGQLVIEITEECYYLTNESEEILIAAQALDGNVRSNMIIGLTQGQNYKSLGSMFKKELCYDGILAKQLLRPCGDLVNVSVSVMIDKLVSNNYCCYIYKLKG
jgi:hypothetical protein